MELAHVHKGGRGRTAPHGLVVMDCSGSHACQCVSALLIIQICVTPGQESVSARLAGMGRYAHVPAHSTHMERVAVTIAVVRMMPSVHQSMEHASVQQVTGAQTAVSCVRAARSVKTVLKDVIVRMVPSAPLRMDVVIAHQVGKVNSATDLAMRNSTAGIATHHAGVSTTQRATPRMGHALVHRATWVSCVSGNVSQDGLDWSAASCATVMMTTVLAVTL